MALLIRKLQSHGDAEPDDDEEYEDEEEDDDEPRSRHEDDDEDEDDDEPRSRHEDDDEDEDDAEAYDDEDDDDEPQARADDEDEEDDESYDDEDEDDEPRARQSSNSGRSRAGDDRGLASTLWEAVVEGVRSSSSAKREKTSRARSRADGDEEDDDSNSRPRGAAKTERRKSATRAPRGFSNRHADDDGEAMALVRQAKRHLVELTGHEAESVSGIERDGDGRARIRLEVVELERIPRTTDVLASYELTLDGKGQLVDCTRVGRYSRSNAGAAVS